MEGLCGFRVGDRVLSVSRDGKEQHGYVDTIYPNRLYLTLDRTPKIKSSWACYIKNGVMMSDCDTGEPLVNLTRQKEAQPTTLELSDSDTNNNNLTKNFMSSLVKKFQSLLLSEPEKTFRKAGVTDESDALTGEGRELFLAFLLKKYGTEFKTEVVDVLVKEEKEDK